MKRCPQCGREYDTSMMFCLDDGAELLYGPMSVNEPATAILHATEPPREAATRAQIHMTDQTAVLPAGTGDVIQPKGRPDRRVWAVPLVIAIVIAGGLFGYRYLKTANAEQVRSIAVMPFENRSGNPDTDYLSDGLTDSLIFRFSQLPDLKVSPTSSVMHYKGSSAELTQIARELDVDALLTGRLTQVQDDLIISVQLIDARTKKLIWAEQYDRKMADLLSTQREIATTLTQKLQLKLSGDEKGLTKKYTNSSEAYQLYLKGRYHWSRRTKEDLLKAIDNYREAIAIDPTFALAYAATAEVYNSMGKNPDAPPKDCIPLAKQAATRALEIDPTLAQAHSALADSLALYDWDWDGSERHFKKALELDPNVSYTYVAYGSSYLAPRGKTSEAVAALERAVALEPSVMINNCLLNTSYLYDRKFDKALAQGRSTYDLDPTFPFATQWLGFALVANGKYDEAIAVAKRVSPDAPFGWTSHVVTGIALAKQGKRTEAQQQISSLLELSKKRYVRPYFIAVIYAALGDKDAAFGQLERSFAERDCYLPRAAPDPFMDPLRDDPRFADLLKRINLK
jgi:TolB-like protein/Flp pilus assembly protein TadD